MQFAVPWALAGLGAALIPILLHLFARREPPTVLFPATRYLADTARLHQRRLRLQHLLLLLARTLLIVALVLAAAGPSLPTGGIGSHAPSAVALVLDNSLSSGAVRGGTPTIDRIKTAARDVLGRATAEDRLWLVAADGIPRQGDGATLGRMADSIRPGLLRLDLGQAVSAGRGLLATAGLPGEVVVISDLQATALGPAAGTSALVVLRPEETAVANAGIASLRAGSQPWGLETGLATIAVTGSDNRSVPAAIGIDGKQSKQALVPVGGNGSVRLTPPANGWWTLTATLDPDELRGDDRRSIALRVAPPARVTWQPADRFIAAALDVLAESGRVARGSDVSFGALGGRAAVVTPPEDPALLGALNRTLERIGSDWTFADLVPGTTVLDSSSWTGRERVIRRHSLRYRGNGPPRGVLATAGATPWMVRSGSIVLLASRLEPAWTTLPISAGFVPFVDALVNRAAREEIVLLEAAPGDRVLLPDRTTAVTAGSRRWTVEGGAPFRPLDGGIHYVLADRDTLGALSVNPDPRESDLTRAGDAQVRALWPGARLARFEDAGAAVFRTGARSDLRGPLLWAAFALGLLEVALASARRATR